MTQILTLLTASSVVQVSDRRLTAWNGGNPHVLDDKANKAVVYLALAAFAYTGAADVGGRTDRWITEVLAPTAGLGQALDSLRDAATQSFSTSPFSVAGLTIVGAGWDPQSDGRFVPFYSVVSNVAQRTPPGVRGAVRDGRAVGYRFDAVGARRPRFDTWAVALQPSMSHLLHVAGQPLIASNEDRLLRNIGRAVSAKAEPTALMRLLAEEIWRVAAINPKVGKSLMAVCLPVTAARTSGPLLVVGGPPKENEFTALYLPDEHAGPEYYLPNLAGAGACFIDAIVEPLGGLES